MKVLVFADIVGRIGRRAIQQVLPEWKLEHDPTLIIANCENLAHGAGVTMKTLHEMFNEGIDIFTSGNHIWDKPSYTEVFADETLKNHVIRPLNETQFIPGEGSTTIEKNGTTFVVMNVLGRVFFKNEYTSPFDAVDEVLENTPNEAITLIDFHAEATSEKAVLSLYLDGRVSAIWGSHTHVPTADERLLPKGTATITDIGMTGAHNESIGIHYDQAIIAVKEQKGVHLTPPDHGSAEVNAVLIEFDEGETKPKSIKRLRKIVEVQKDELLD